MRSYGRVKDPTTGQFVPDPDTGMLWRVVESAGADDTPVWLTTLCQTLLLGLNESPFYANYGIPFQQTVVSQVQPDFYLSRTQAQYAPHFASLLVAKQAAASANSGPVYKVAVTTFQGAREIVTVAQ